jgi:hypothetical protein
MVRKVKQFLLHKWANTAWKTVKANPPHKEICNCVLDVENNGIKTAVAWVANHYKSGTPITLLLYLQSIINYGKSAQEENEDSKGIHQSENDRQHNGQKTG